MILYREYPIECKKKKKKKLLELIVPKLLELINEFNKVSE